MGINYQELYEREVQKTHNLKQEILRLQSVKDQSVQVGDWFLTNVFSEGFDGADEVRSIKKNSDGKTLVGGSRYGNIPLENLHKVSQEVADYINETVDSLEKSKTQIADLKARHNDELQLHMKKTGIAEKERDDALAKLEEFQRPLKVGDQVLAGSLTYESGTIKQERTSGGWWVHLHDAPFPDRWTHFEEFQVLRILDNQTVIGPHTLNAIHESPEEEQANDAHVEAIDQAEVSRLLYENETLKIELDQAKQDKAILADTIGNLNGRVEELIQEKSQMTDLAERFASKAKINYEDCESLRLECDRLKEMNDRQLKTIAEYMEADSKWKADWTALEDELNVTKKKLEGKQEAYDNVVAIAKRVVNERDEAFKDLENLRKELESTKMAMSSEIESLKEKLADDAMGSKAISELQTENGKLRSENQRMANRLTWMNGQWVRCLERSAESQKTTQDHLHHMWIPTASGDDAQCADCYKMRSTVVSPICPIREWAYADEKRKTSP